MGQQGHQPGLRGEAGVVEVQGVEQAGQNQARGDPRPRRRAILPGQDEIDRGQAGGRHDGRGRGRRQDVGTLEPARCRPHGQGDGGEHFRPVGQRLAVEVRQRHWLTRRRCVGRAQLGEALPRFAPGAAEAEVQTGGGDGHDEGLDGQHGRPQRSHRVRGGVAPPEGPQGRGGPQAEAQGAEFHPSPAARQGQAGGAEDGIKDGRPQGFAGGKQAVIGGQEDGGKRDGGAAAEIDDGVAAIGQPNEQFGGGCQHHQQGGQGGAAAGADGGMEHCGAQCGAVTA